MRVRAIVSYDGTDFVGFQRQSTGRTVQGELERALQELAKRAVTVTGAGRTDSGVHASGQVVAFDLDWGHPLDALQRAINVTLPADVAVRCVEQCADEFHPRFDAKSRRYRYVIAVRPERNPLHRRMEWQISSPLNWVEMDRACKAFIGGHDFAAFGSPTVGESTRRTVLAAEWHNIGMADDDMHFGGRSAERMAFEIEADGFLFRMVRRIVATLVRVGQSKLSPAEVAEILASRDGDRVKGAAPACGLSLIKVKY